VIDSLAAEHLGAARVFRRRVALEDDRYIKGTHALTRPIVDRLKRYPRRGIRPELIDGMLARLRDLRCEEFSLDFATSRTRHGCLITERRLCAAAINDDDDPAFATERVVAVGELKVSIDRNHIRQQLDVLTVFSIRALGEFIGWHDPGDEASLIRALDAAGRFDTNRIPLWRGGQIPTESGRWLARGVQFDTGDGLARRVVRCHGWIPVGEGD
jgi:hypothetical protein